MEIAAVVAILLGSWLRCTRTSIDHEGKRGRGMCKFAQMLSLALQGVSFGISAYTTPGTEGLHNVCSKHSVASVLLP